MMSIRALKVTLLFIATLTVLSGAIIAPSLPHLVEHFIKSGVAQDDAAFWGRMLLSVPALFILLFSPIMGYIIDKFGRRKVLFAGLSLYAITGVWGGIFPTLNVLIITRLGLGIAIAMTMTASLTLAGDYFKGADRERFFGHFSSAMSFGGIIYFIMGGFAAEFNWRAPFFIYLVSLVALALAIRYIDEPNFETEKRVEIQSRMKTPVATIFLLYFTAIFLMIIYYSVPLQIPFLLHEIGLTSAAFTGLSMASTSIGIMLASLQYRRLKEKLSHEIIFVLGFSSLFSGYTLIGTFGTSLHGIVPGLFFAGVGLGMIMPNTNTWIINITPPHLRGRVTGGLSSSINLGQFICPLIAFPLQQSYGNRLVYGVLAIPALIMGLIYLVLYFKKNNR